MRKNEFQTLENHIRYETYDLPLELNYYLEVNSRFDDKF